MRVNVIWLPALRTSDVALLTNCATLNLTVPVVVLLNTQMGVQVNVVFTPELAESISLFPAVHAPMVYKAGLVTGLDPPPLPFARIG